MSCPFTPEEITVPIRIPTVKVSRTENVYAPGDLPSNVLKSACALIHNDFTQITCAKLYLRTMLLVRLGRMR